MTLIQTTPTRTRCYGCGSVPIRCVFRKTTHGRVMPLCSHCLLSVTGLQVWTEEDKPGRPAGKGEQE